VELEDNFNFQVLARFASGIWKIYEFYVTIDTEMAKTSKYIKFDNHVLDFNLISQRTLVFVNEPNLDTYVFKSMKVKDEKTQANTIQGTELEFYFSDGDLIVEKFSFSNLAKESDDVDAVTIEEPVIKPKMYLRTGVMLSRSLIEEFTTEVVHNYIIQLTRLLFNA